ncbi:MAG: hypothetical protein AUI15_02775 [Actinobacteria bacterium 13_2_20CM_2_66_6]|nr:MAG: hypothetical protein AUI15_02775 [Actinobacteria bacterium 13_2_20CM_2_66_6]
MVPAKLEPTRFDVALPEVLGQPVVSASAGMEAAGPANKAAAVAPAKPPAATSDRKLNHFLTTGSPP